MTDANDLSSPRSEATDAPGVAPLDPPSPDEFDSADFADTSDSSDHLSCAYCHRTFNRPEFRALHHGRSHPEALTDDEADAYESARDDEADALRQFQLKAVFAIIVLYFVLLMLTALV